MVAGLRILSSGFLGPIQGQNTGKTNVTPNPLRVAPASQKLLKRATVQYAPPLKPAFDMGNISVILRKAIKHEKAPVFRWGSFG